MSRLCKNCGTDITDRHYHATLCIPCLKTWGKRTGSALACQAVATAIRHGKIPPAKTLACTDCSGPAMDYDHRDYNQPLNVEPVCRSCNRKRGPAIPLQYREAV